MAKATDHPQCPIQDQYVRVHEYKSHMVIRPHTTFDKVNVIIFKITGGGGGQERNLIMDGGESASIFQFGRGVGKI